MSNASGFSWSWIVKDFIQVQKEEEIRCRMSTSSIKCQARRFHVVVAAVVVQWTSKKCTKKRDARAERSTLRKLPIILRELIAFKRITFWKQNFVTVYTGLHVAGQFYEWLSQNPGIKPLSVSTRGLLTPKWRGNRLEKSLFSCVCGRAAGTLGLYQPMMNSNFATLT